MRSPFYKYYCENYIYIYINCGENYILSINITVKTISIYILTAVKIISFP